MKMQTSLALVALLILSFELFPHALAVSPAPDGGYPGGNTSEGQNALLSLTSGTYNTAVGFDSLAFNTTGPQNTAIGTSALASNITGSSNTVVGARAGLLNVTGDNNTGLGREAGQNITGSGNVCIGAGVFGEAGVDDSTYIRNINTT